MQLRTKPIACIGTSLLLATLVAACSGSGGGGAGGSGGSGGAYQVGFVDGITGPLAPYTGPELLWAKAVFNSVNATGGINGHKIDLQTVDSGAPGSGQAPAAVIKLATQTKVSAILGFTISDDCSSVKTVIARYQTPIVCRSVAAADLAPVNKYIFSSLQLENQTISAEFKYAKKLTGSANPRVALLGNDNVGVNNWLSAWKAQASGAGVTIATSQDMSETASTVAPYLAAIVASKPQVLFTNIFGQFNAPLAQGLKNAGIKTSIISENTMPWSEVTSINNPNIVTIGQTVVPLLPTQSNLTSAQKQLLAQFKALGADSADQINGGNGTTYSLAPYAIVAGLKACGYPCSGAKMATSLEHIKLNVPGVIPNNFSFSSTDHSGPQSVSWYRWNVAKKTVVPEFTASMTKPQS